MISENEAIAACIAAAQTLTGRNWKQTVRLAWETGQYDRLGLSDLAGALQRTRNVFGPSWLNRLRLPKAAK